MPVTVSIRKLALATATLILANTIDGRWAKAADVDNGRNIARRWCSSCHLVAPDQTQASADVPSFASIAGRPGFTSQAIATFLQDPHPKMPSFGLTRNETDEIAEYIASLAGKQQKLNPKPIEKDFTL